MKTQKDVTIPVKLKNGEWSTRKVEYEQLIKVMKANIDRIPDIVTALKKADNSGWQRLLDELTPYIDKHKHLAKLFKVVEKDGRQVISIGEPNWVIAPLMFVMFAFSVGFIIGTVCVGLGPCQFVNGREPPDPE